MTTRSSPAGVPANDVTVTQVQTSPLWRLIGVSALIAAITYVARGLALSNTLESFSVIMGSASAFLIQHVIFRDPNTVARLTGVWTPLAEVVLNLREASARRSFWRLLPTALLYGVTILGVQKLVHHAAGLLVNRDIAIGVGLFLVSVAVIPELWKAAKERIDDRTSAPSDATDAPPRTKPAATKKPTRVRLTLPAGEVQAEGLEKALTARGMSDVEKFVTEFNARTADREGTVRTVISIYDDGTHSFTVADEEA